VCHLGDELADIIGSAQNETFGGRDNGRVRFAESTQQVEIQEESAVVRRGKFIEHIEADGMKPSLEVGREKTVVQSSSSPDVGRDVSIGSMDEVDDVIKRMFRTGGCYKSWVAAQSFVKVADNHDVLIIPMACLNIP
jgi:hypothetical protein